MRNASLALILVLMTRSVQAQTVPAQTVPAPKPIVVPEATEFVARFADSLSSKWSAEGDNVRLRVDEAIVDGADTLIKEGAIVRGVLTEVKGAGFMGRSGKLNMRLETVTLADGQRAKIRASKAKDGDEKRGQTIALTVLFGPLGLLRRGDDAEIKKGTPMHLFTDEEVTLHPRQ